jgi:hypothetical protein
MKGIQIWDVDRLVAARILTDLGLEPSDTKIDIIARHTADHRQESASWAARRVQIGLLERLSTFLQSGTRPHRNDWYDGFREAEACIATTDTRETLQLSPSATRTVGDIVRSEIRRTKSQSPRL